MIAKLEAADPTLPATNTPDPSPGNGHSPKRKSRRAPIEESAESRARQLLAAMVAFRDGDFSVRLPTDWAGTEGRIAEAFNQTIAHEDRISQEKCGV